MLNAIVFSPVIKTTISLVRNNLLTKFQSLKSSTGNWLWDLISLSAICVCYRPECKKNRLTIKKQSMPIKWQITANWQCFMLPIIEQKAVLFRDWFFSGLHLYRYSYWHLRHGSWNFSPEWSSVTILTLLSLPMSCKRSAQIKVKWKVLGVKVELILLQPDCSFNVNEEQPEKYSR